MPVARHCHSGEWGDGRCLWTLPMSPGGANPPPVEILLSRGRDCVCVSGSLGAKTSGKIWSSVFFSQIWYIMKFSIRSVKVMRLLKNLEANIVFYLSTYAPISSCPATPTHAPILHLKAMLIIMLIICTVSWVFYPVSTAVEYSFVLSVYGIRLVLSSPAFMVFH